MDCNELLMLLTLGAVAPYLAEASIRWIRFAGKPRSGAGAPAWFRCRKTSAGD